MGLLPKNYEFLKGWRMMIIPLSFYFFGKWVAYKEDATLTMFRDKSALYGKEKAPGEPPSWPKPFGIANGTFTI